jgi:hypothetical protein
MQLSSVQSDGSLWHFSLQLLLAANHNAAATAKIATRIKTNADFLIFIAQL